MRVLIDACLPIELKEHLSDLNAQTTREMGWQHLKNGKLLELAQREFDVARLYWFVSFISAFCFPNFCFAFVPRLLSIVRTPF